MESVPHLASKISQISRDVTGETSTGRYEGDQRICGGSIFSVHVPFPFVVRGVVRQVATEEDRLEGLGPASGHVWRSLASDTRWREVVWKRKGVLRQQSLPSLTPHGVPMRIMPPMRQPR
jgi:hypothetical protein